MEEPMEVSTGLADSEKAGSEAIGMDQYNNLNESDVSNEGENQDSEIEDNVNGIEKLENDAPSEDPLKENHVPSDDPLKLDTSDVEEVVKMCTDTIVIQSDSEPEINGDEDQNKNKENRSEIHDNRVSNKDINVEKEPDKLEKEFLRRSSRKISNIIYNEDDDSSEETEEEESDIEEVRIITSPRRRRPRNDAYVVKNTKALVEMASKMTPNQGKNQKRKEPTLVILDTNHNNSHKSQVTVLQKKNTPKIAPNLYNKFTSQGVTVSTVNEKNLNIPSQIVQPIPPPIILPSLTDDMFVVEAPSFIVPYVYEKPSLKPFRKFVDEFGKEVEKQLKEEQELLKKEELVKKQQECFKSEDDSQTTIDTKKDDDIPNDCKDENEPSDIKLNGPKDETKDGEIELTSKKSTKKERRPRKTEEDDESWDGESSSGSEQSDAEKKQKEKVEIIKEKVDILNDISKVTVDVNSNKTIVGEPESYFSCSLGKFFIDIGVNLVQEHIQKLLLAQQNYNLRKETKQGKNTTETLKIIAALSDNYKYSMEKNEPFKFKLKKCKLCNFKTESAIVLDNHLEKPHYKDNVYFCTYCPFQNRNVHDILCHIDMEHKVRARLEVAPTYYQCPNCPFEDNRKNRFTKHSLSCSKKFKPDINLMPPLDWEPPAKIPKIVRSQKSIMPAFQKGLIRPQLQFGKDFGLNSHPYFYDANVNKSLQAVAALQNAALIRSSLLLQNSGTTVTKRANLPIMNNVQNRNAAPQKPANQPSISIIPLPRHPQPPFPAPVSMIKPKESYVTCEICDGFIQNLDLLRSHLQWIHQLKVHPKLIQNRPPLNCQKCQYRFFTDQGLERHLLGSHGLVTTSMQEAADAGRDSGRCPICGRVFNWKLLTHVAKDHSLTLKPAHLSYKCTVCTATFSQYKQFENHVYSSHTAIARSAVDKNKTYVTTNNKISQINKPSTSTFKGK